MNPLSMLFGAGVALRNTLYDRGMFKTHKLSRPVISIGNISVGGSGKTPFVIALGELLKQRGIAFDVLSRGYGRSSTETAIVDPAGTPEQFGDEPLLIARKLQVPVVVGADRYQAGLLAEREFNSRLHLLDDGFQHRRLHRDFDIVLLPGHDLIDKLLPEGRLREPRSSLRRADAIVVFKGLEIPQLYMRVHAHSEALVWLARRNITLDTSVDKAIAFCGIARPQQFFDGIRVLGQEIVSQLAFRDHHRYIRDDIGRLLKLKQSTGANSFITTEKDLINLGPFAAELQPLRVAQLGIQFESLPEAVLTRILQKIEGRTGCRL